MNKEMRMILTQIEAKHQEANGHYKTGDTQKAAQALDEADALQEKYNLAERMYLSAKKMVPDAPPEKEKKSSGFSFVLKMVKREKLNEEEKAMVVDGNSGENYLIPEDVDTTIRELKRESKSAKDLITVIPTSSTGGHFVFEKGGGNGLENFSDGDDIDSSEQPEFEKKPFTINFFGKIIPVSNILKGAERGGLIAYLKKWFVKNAVLTENTKIFAALLKGKTPKTLKGWRELKSSINLDLDPDSLISGVIITNQSGFDLLDKEEDERGRPILQENPQQKTAKMFQSLPIHVFSDKVLENIKGKPPVIYGDTKDGCYMLEMIGYEFAASEHALFGKNQTALRVIEGFDVIQADDEAYMVGVLEPTPKTEETA